MLAAAVLSSTPWQGEGGRGAGPAQHAPAESPLGRGAGGAELTPTWQQRAAAAVGEVGQAA